MNLKPNWPPLIAQFKNEVRDNADRIDPQSEEHWQSITIGWAIGKGLSPEEAREFAVYVRYETDLG